jgi:hypothetical protein
MSDDRVASRAAHPLPEEQPATDPQRQAEALLADSDARTAQAAAGPDETVEHRTSPEAAT